MIVKLDLTDDKSPLVQVMAWCFVMLTQIYVAMWRHMATMSWPKFFFLSKT